MKNDSTRWFLPFGRQHYGLHHLLMAILIGAAFYAGTKIGNVFS